MRAHARAHTHTVLKIKLRALDSIQLLSYELRSYHQRFLSLSPIKWHKPVVSVTQKAEAGGSHATVSLGYRVSSRFTLCAPFSKLKVKGGLEIQCGGGTLELCSQSPGFSTTHPRICYLCVPCISFWLLQMMCCQSQPVQAWMRMGTSRWREGRRTGSSQLPPSTR